MTLTKLHKTAYLFPFIFFLFLFSNQAKAYGVLTHQALIDEAWEGEIKPLLLKNYPNATEEDLLKAKAYAYGGAVIHDMGYFPFGKEFYSDLVHYVRTGDFVEALFSEATNLNEYAFAVGALSHFYGDKFGHSLAVNRAVPHLYPKARKHYGVVATYHDNPRMHLKAEMGYDVLQIAIGRYPSDAYKKLIGFKVAQEALERAFLKTYGLELDEQFVSLKFSLFVYRKLVKVIMPSLIRIAWQVKSNSMSSDTTEYPYLQQKWAEDYTDPGFEERVFAFLIKNLPKPGPLDPFTFKPADKEAEQLLHTSYHTSLDFFKGSLILLQTDSLVLTNTGLDTGEPTKPGQYTLTDETYDMLLYRLKKNDYKYLSADLKKHLQNYYQQPQAVLPEHFHDYQYRLKLLSKLEQYQDQH